MIHAVALTILLNVVNVADAPRSIVTRAQDEVIRLYRDIGVEIAFEGPQIAAGAGPAMPVVIVPYESGWLQRQPKTVMGAAIRTERGLGVAYVFYRRVEREARQYGSSEALVLACAIAHEVAHLLLPGRDHSAWGLMRACWDRDDFGRAERGQLRFSDEEASLIRASLADGR
jgi:hypothetical protein